MQIKTRTLPAGSIVRSRSTQNLFTTVDVGPNAIGDISVRASPTALATWLSAGEWDLVSVPYITKEILDACQNPDCRALTTLDVGVANIIFGWLQHAQWMNGSGNWRDVDSDSLSWTRENCQGHVLRLDPEMPVQEPIPTPPAKALPPIPTPRGCVNYAVTDKNGRWFVADLNLYLVDALGLVCFRGLGYRDNNGVLSWCQALDSQRGTPVVVRVNKS